jgi:hypothetical protein
MALERTFHRFTSLQLIVAQTISSVKEGSTGLTLHRHHQCPSILATDRKATPLQYEAGGNKTSQKPYNYGLLLPALYQTKLLPCRIA